MRRRANGIGMASNSAEKKGSPSGANQAFFVQKRFELPSRGGQAFSNCEILFTQCLFFDTIVIYYNEDKQQINNSHNFYVMLLWHYKPFHFFYNMIKKLKFILKFL